MPGADTPPPAVSWQAPVAPLQIVRAYREAPRFAAGGHRGIDLGVVPGAAVAAPCGGRITFRGPVAGGPPTVTVDCGRLRATLQRLAPSVRVGEQVRRGERVGRAAGDAVDLSARRPDGTYLDPAALLGREQGGGPAPIASARERPQRRGRPAPTRPQAQVPARLADRALVTPQPRGGAAPHQSHGARGVDVPLGAGGLAVMAAALAGLAAQAARRRRRGPNVARRASLARAQR